MYCARHPEKDAPWECVWCGKLHCDDCVRRIALRPDSPKFMSACSHCDGTLRRIAEIVPAETDERRALYLLPLSTMGLRTISVVAVLGALSSMHFPLLGLGFGVLYVTALAGTAWHVAAHVARGRSDFPAPVEADGTPPLGQIQAGMTCLLAVFFPFGIWWGFHASAETMSEVFERHPGQGAALVVAVALYGPAAILTSVAMGGALGAMWPPGWIMMVRRAGSLYPAIAGRIVGATAVLFAARWLISRSIGVVPILGQLVFAGLTAAIVFSAAAILGGFLRRHRDALGLIW